MLINKISLLILILGIASCSNDLTHHKVVEGTRPDLNEKEIENWQHLTGKWYGSQKEVDGTRFEWILIRKANGQFEYISRNYRGDVIHDEWIEFGEWGLAGPIYFVTTKAWVEEGKIVYTDMTDPYRRAAYEVISLTESDFHYRAYSDGSEFKMVKVEDDFDFPN